MDRTTIMNSLRQSRAFPVPIKQFDKYDYIENRGFLSHEECDKIIEYGEKQNLHWGTTYSEGGTEVSAGGSHRIVKSSALPDDEFGWLYDRLAYDVQQLNDSFYGFDIRGLYEDIQFLKYTEFEERGPGKFDWHTDTDGTSIVNRKITTIIQLSGPEDYTDCDLHLWDSGEIKCDNARDKGMLIAFPSYQSHKISPITSGTRYSLVTWVSGPNFK